MMAENKALVEAWVKTLRGAKFDGMWLNAKAANALADLLASLAPAEERSPPTYFSPEHQAKVDAANEHWAERSVGSGEVPAYAWVIEGSWSETFQPDYWAGGSTWSGDHLKALRFARKEDAQQAADFMLDGMNIRICEHAWG